MNRCIARRTEVCGRFHKINKCNVNPKYGIQHRNVIVNGRCCDICCKYSFDKSGSNMYYEFKNNGDHILFDKYDNSIDHIRVLDKLIR